MSQRTFPFRLRSRPTTGAEPASGSLQLERQDETGAREALIPSLLHPLGFGCSWARCWSACASNWWPRPESADSACGGWKSEAKANRGMVLRQATWVDL